MDVLQNDLDEVRRQWNVDRIRPSVGARCPAGIPDRLYFIPTPPAVDCLVENINILSPQVINQLKSESKCHDECFQDYVMYLCQLNNWNVPSTVDQATELYFKLLPLVNR